MVYFTCFHCGDSLKKPAVTKHLQTKCKKKEPLLTCMDCMKDFKGNEFEAHTKCVTEEERYAAKGHSKPTVNKGEKKQQAWQTCMQTVLKKPNLKPDEKDLIRAISKYDNVPRKKSKFVNFLTNAFRQYSNKKELIERVWEEIESVYKETTITTNEANKIQKPPEPAKSLKVTSGKPEAKASKVNAKVEDTSNKKDKKRKRAPEDEKVNGKTEINKSEDKQKKKKQKSSEEKKVEGNNDIDMLICDESESTKDKLIRKRKADEDSQTESNHSFADEGEPGKKKKKKKQDKPEEVQVSQATAGKTEAESNNKKKNKKPQSATSETKADSEKAKGGGDANQLKKDKKSKKSENKENVSDKQSSAGKESGKASAQKGEKASVKPGDKPAQKTNEKTTAKGNDKSTEKVPAKTGGKSQKAEVRGDGEKGAPKAKKGKTEATVKQPDSKKQDEFNWKATILQVLNQDGKNNRIQLQKLQQKVLKLHCQTFNCENSEKKEQKFMKKLKEMQEVSMDKDFVVLKS